MNITKILAALALLLTLSSAWAQPDLEQRNRFRVGGQLHFNVSGSMRNVPVPANVGPFYDDGFVANDSSDSLGGKSWNWGYSFSNQIIGASAPRMLELHGATSPRDGVTDKLDATMQYGFEVAYGREFWRFGDEKKPKRVGFELAFSANALRLDLDNTVTGTVTRRADRYSLGTVVPPRAPYTGSFDGPAPPNPPAPLINTNYTTSTSTETATSTQAADIEGTYWGFRIGPYAELPLPGRFQLQVGAGIAVVHVDATLGYTERFTITGLGGPPPERFDAQDKNDWLMGFYTEARLQYWINDVVALYVGGQFQAIDKFRIEAASREATVDFGSSFGTVFGVIYSF